MTFVYIVRCNFTEPAQEQAWNDWYSGPKIVQMLAQPYFLSCQRFHRAAGTGRDYLALWTVQSPEALRTRQYTAQWGFAEWASLITDWSRDLFDGGDVLETAFAVQPEGSLRVVAFDGMRGDEAAAARSTLASESGMMWLPIAGLDRHTPLIGLGPRADSAGAAGSGPGEHAVYRPISGFHRAGNN